MYCFDYPERHHPGNQLSFMLHKLMFLGCHLEFASYPYTFASYSHSCKILQPYVVATVRVHSDAIFSSIGASLMKTFIKNQCSATNSGYLETTVSSDAPDDTCESAFTTLRSVQNSALFSFFTFVLRFLHWFYAARPKATSHLCVRRERPLIITYSLYSENIIHYHFYLKHVSGEE